MAEKFYLDTSVWMDYYEDRKDPHKDLGEIAFKLLSKLLIAKSTIIVSAPLLRELGRYYSLDEIRGMMRPYETILQRAVASEQQTEEARMIGLSRKIPGGDAVHAILARDNDAILISRDKHFQLLKDICKTAKPEDII